jgi:hypothetical protein
MNLDQPQGSGRVVPQAKNGGGGGGGGFMAKLGAMVSGAYTQTLRSQNQLAMEYQREIIRSAGDKTRKDNTFEHQTNVLNDLDRRRASGSGVEQAFGVRYKSDYKPTPNPEGTKPGTPPKGGSKRSKGGTVAATVGAIKSGNVDFEQATGGEFGDEAGISPKLSADFGAHAAAGGNQESYLNQFTPSGRRKRTKPDKPNDPPPPPPGGGSGGGSATATAAAPTATKRTRKAAATKPAGSANPTTGNSGNGNKK